MRFTLAGYPHFHGEGDDFRANEIRNEIMFAKVVRTTCNRSQINKVSILPQYSINTVVAKQYL